ncbi:cysteine desulfurase [Candidatus Peregrinibacteria bacterium]|nr:cysteine desulfurase [Candidatus Peregrinibacteria bacterium]
MRAVTSPSRLSKTLQKSGEPASQSTIKGLKNNESPWRSDFPIFHSQPELVYLDSAATALKPRLVLEALFSYYTEYPANVHRGLYDMSEKATAAYEEARRKVRDFIHAKSEKEIIFTRGATEGLNLIALGWGGQFLKSGDEIILSILEHHSNIVPWQLIAKKKNAAIKYLDIDESGALKTEQLNKLLSKRTRIISMSHVSNALGTISNLKPVIQKAHAVGAKVAVDAAQSAPHIPLDVQYLDADFLVFSGHKLGGPTGIGVLYVKEKILETMEPLFGGGDMIREVTKTRATWNDVPWKFEAGTPPIAGAIGLGAAVAYLKNIGASAMRTHEKKLMHPALALLKKTPGVRIFGPGDAERQTAVISFAMDGIHPHDIAALLNESHIAIRAGHHCCMPLMERLGVPATARISFFIYNTEDDIAKLERGLWKVKKTFSR